MQSIDLIRRAAGPPPQPPPREDVPVVLSYGRQSDPSASGNNKTSPERQLALVKSMLSRQGTYRFVDFIDRFRSGDDPNRPGMLEFEEHIKLRPEYAAAWAPSRWHRDLRKMLDFADLCEEYDVKMFTCTHGVITRSQVVQIAEADEQFLTALREATAMGLQEVTEQGRSMGPRPYGYEKSAQAGVSKINEEKIAVVRQIFDYAVHGNSASEIAVRLNALEVPAPSIEYWTTDSVKRVLNQPMYAGVVRSGQHVIHRDRKTKTVSRRAQHPSMWTYGVSVSAPVIDMKTWIATRPENERAILTSAETASSDDGVVPAPKRNTRAPSAPPNFLGGRMKCPCGAGMRARSGGAAGVAYIKCHRAAMQAGCDRTQSVRRDSVEQFVLDHVLDIVRRPSAVVKAVEALGDARRKAEDRFHDVLTSTRSELRTVQREQDELASAIAKGNILHDTVRRREAELVAMVDKFQSRMLRVEAKQKRLASRPDPQSVVERAIADLQYLLDDPRDKERVALFAPAIRTLYDEVVVTSADDVIVEIVGPFPATRTVPRPARGRRRKT